MLTLAPVGMYNCVNMSEFELLLAANRWKKADLARALGVTKTTVSRWKDSAPGYAMAYLRLRADIVKAINKGEA